MLAFKCFIRKKQKGTINYFSSYKPENEEQIKLKVSRKEECYKVLKFANKYKILFFFNVRKG